MKLAKIYFSILLFFSLLTQLNASINLNPPKTKQKKIGCERVYLTNDFVNEYKKPTVLYGTTLYVIFESIKGFEPKNDKIAPKMRINIFDSKNKLAFGTNKGFIDLEEQSADASFIYSYISFASPINSNDTYRIKIEIRDQNGSGYIKHEFSIKLIQDKKIELERSGLSNTEVYLFSQEKNSANTDHIGTYNEDIHLIVEGLDGFNTENGMVNLGFDLRVEDEDGNVILDQKDMLSEPVPSAALYDRVSGKFKITESQLDKMNTRCIVLFYDKTDKKKFLLVNTEVLFVAPEEE